jgi:hypothetical protein
MSEDILKSVKDIQRRAAEHCSVTIPLSVLQDLIAEIDKWTAIAIANHQEQTHGQPGHRPQPPQSGPKLVDH